MQNKKTVYVGIDKNGKRVSISDRVTNGHVAISGISGSGKSTEMMSLALQYAMVGNIVIVLNWRRSHDVGCISSKFRRDYMSRRQHIDVAMDGLRIPLFDCCKDMNDRTESVPSVIHRVTNLLAKCGNLTPTQTSVLKNAVAEVAKLGLYKTEGIRSVKRFLETQDYKTALNAAGKLGAVCDENCLVDGNFLEELNGSICEIDVNGLQYDDQTVMVNVFLDFLLRMANLGRFMQKNVTIVIDECQNLNFKPDSTMSVLLNESRKLGVNLVLAAPRMLIGQKNNMSAMQQCGTILNFKPVSEDRRKLAKQIDPANPDAQMFLLSELQTGQFVASGNFLVADREKKGPLSLYTYFGNASGEAALSGKDKKVG